MAEEFLVSREEAGERLDVVLSRRLAEVSRSRIRAWIEEGRVEVPQAREVKPSLSLKEGWTILCDRPLPAASRLQAEPIPIDVIHEDADILILNKPAGLAVHPGAGRRSGTLAHGLLALYPGRVWPGSPERPGIVHRLDRDTSGLMAIACNDLSYARLVEQIQAREVTRGYLALVWGIPTSPAGVIDAPIGRDPRERTRMAVVRRGGRPSRTRYRILRLFDPLCLLEVRLETGRTHQIRVHMAHAGFPVFGDSAYGGGQRFLARIAPHERPRWARRLARLNRQALHAYHLSLRHPGDGRRWTFEAPPPGDLEELLIELAGGAEER